MVRRWQPLAVIALAACTARPDPAPRVDAPAEVRAAPDAQPSVQEDTMIEAATDDTPLAGHAPPPPPAPLLAERSPLPARRFDASPELHRADEQWARATQAYAAARFDVAADAFLRFAAAVARVDTAGEPGLQQWRAVAYANAASAFAAGGQSAVGATRLASIDDPGAAAALAKARAQLAPR
jgi:hypothetical protein